MYEEFLSERLSMLRNNKGISAREMSLMLGQGEGYINTIENKKSLPSMANFFYICECLGVTPHGFFDEGISNPVLIDELVAELRNLSDDALHHILCLIREWAKDRKG